MRKEVRGLGVIACALSLLLGLLLWVFLASSAGTTSKGLPVGVVGTAAQEERVQSHARALDSEFAVTHYLSRQDAERAVRERRAYAAFVFEKGDSPNAEILTASAGSESATAIVTRVVQDMGQNAEPASAEAKRQAALHAAGLAAKATAARAAATTATSFADQVKKTLPDNLPLVGDLEKKAKDLQVAADNAERAADDAQKGLFSLDSPKLTETDLAPFNDHDPRGAGLRSLTLPLVLSGILASLSVRPAAARISAMRRSAGLKEEPFLDLLTAMGTVSLLGGMATVLVAQAGMGVLQGPWALNGLASALALAAVASVPAGLSELVRLWTARNSARWAGANGASWAGLAGGLALTAMLGLPVAGTDTPSELLPRLWGGLGRLLPPGAVSTLFRHTSYFPEAPTLVPWAVLLLWTTLGVLLMWASAGGWASLKAGTRRPGRHTVGRAKTERAKTERAKAERAKADRAATRKRGKGPQLSLRPSPTAKD